MFKEFKEFAFKGNVVDMAVGIIIGGAFSTIVSSLVNDIIMPIFGNITAGMDFKNLKIVLSEAVMDGATVIKPEAAINYGVFIQNVISFLIIAISMFFVVNVMNKAFRKKDEKPKEPPKPTQEELLTEIRDLFKENK